MLLKLSVVRFKESTILRRKIIKLKKIIKKKVQKMSEQEKYGYEEWAGYESEMKRKRSCLEKIKMKGRKSD